MNDHQWHFFQRRHRAWRNRHYRRGEFAFAACIFLALFSAMAGTSEDPRVVLIAWPLCLALFVAALPACFIVWGLSAWLLDGGTFKDPDGYPVPKGWER